MKNDLTIIMTAISLKKNQKGIIKKIDVINKIQRQRLLDLGFLPNEEIMCYAKLKGNVAFKVKYSIFALRTEIANQIILK